jgi:hypothetical protein
MDKLLTLLTLHRQAQDAETISAFAHIAVNETVKIIPYKQAIFWLQEDGVTKLHTASGNASLEKLSPAMISLQSEIKKAISEREQREISPHIIGPKTSQGIKPKSLSVLLETKEEGLLGGLYLERDEAFSEADFHILSELAFSYAQALAVKNYRGRSLWQYSKQSVKKVKIPLIIFSLVLLCWPVRLTATAPAEIVAQNPTVVSVPFNGTLENIAVDPGDRVVEGQVIAQMEALNLESLRDNTQQQLEIARMQLSQIRREALSESEKRQDLRRLENEIILKEIEFEHAKEQLKLSAIRAPRDGVAIYADKNELQGKPVQTGDSIMTIADPLEGAVRIRVPSDSMIPIKTDTEIRFFLNVAPLKGYNAIIESIGYQATQDPDGLLSYKIKARLADNHPNIRIGWKGTAKIYGDRVILGYALLRRPITLLRNLTGL